MTIADAKSTYSAASLAGSRPALLLPVLMIGMMAQGLAFTAFIAALPQMAQDLGPRGPVIAPMTMAATALGLMLGALVSGWVLEKLGTRRTLVVSLLIYGLLGASAVVARDPIVLLATRFATGFSTACLVTTCVWSISAEYAGDRRARVLGNASSLANVSALAGTLIGGYLARNGGWQLPFVLYLIFGAVALPLVPLGIRQVWPEQDVSDGRREPFFGQLLPFFLLAVLLFVVLFMASTQYAFLLEEQGMHDPVLRALIIGTTTAAGALMAFLYGPLQARLRIKGTFVLGLVAMTLALCTIGLGLTVRTPIAFVSAALMGIYAGLVLPYLYHSVTVRTDLHVRSRAIGLLTAFGFLGGFLNPPVFVALSKQIGLRNAFLVTSVVMAVAAAATLLRAPGPVQVA